MKKKSFEEELISLFEEEAKSRKKEVIIAGVCAVISIIFTSFLILCL